MYARVYLMPLFWGHYLNMNDWFCENESVMILGWEDVIVIKICQQFAYDTKREDVLKFPVK